MINLQKKEKFTVNELADVIIEWEIKPLEISEYKLNFQAKYKKMFNSKRTSIYRLLENELEYPVFLVMGSKWIPYETADKIVNPSIKSKKILRTAIIYGHNNNAYVINLDIIGKSVNPIISDNQYIWNYAPCDLCENEDRETICRNCKPNKLNNGFTMFKLANCYRISEQKKLGNYL